MATTNLTIRMDEDLKQQVKELVDDLGMDMTTFFTIYAKKAVRVWGIPFEISAKITNKETLEAFEEVERMKEDVENGRNTSRAYSSVEEMMEDLLKDED